MSHGCSGTCSLYESAAAARGSFVRSWPDAEEKSTCNSKARGLRRSTPSWLSYLAGPLDSPREPVVGIGMTSYIIQPVMRSGHPNHERAHAARGSEAEEASGFAGPCFSRDLTAGMIVAALSEAGERAQSRHWISSSNGTIEDWLSL